MIESLKKELNPMAFNGEFFEVSYDKDLLSKLKKLYYFNFNRTDSDENKDQHFNFLGLKSNDSFCAPKLSEVHSIAIDLPYFWCRGLECFQNCLNEQTVENCSSWKKYSLYHMIEILGLPKLKKTEAGFEPDETVKEFIPIANRAITKFNRLRCKACGHLLFTDKNSGFNRYNYYLCINPSCSEYNHPIYLNYCFKCKKGLIDSRDSKQCPNGWYICPECHSCCDDAQYERLAQRYILQKRFVPQRIENKRGQGHNDKGIYFCHKCGEQLIYEEDKLKCKKCDYSIN